MYCSTEKWRKGQRERADTRRATCRIEHPSRNSQSLKSFERWCGKTLDFRALRTLEFHKRSSAGKVYANIPKFKTLKSELVPSPRIRDSELGPSAGEHTELFKAG